MDLLDQATRIQAKIQTLLETEDRIDVQDVDGRRSNRYAEQKEEQEWTTSYASIQAMKDLKLKFREVPYDVS